VTVEHHGDAIVVRPAAAWVPAVACTVACAMAFAAFPVVPGVRWGLVVAALFRGVWSGLVGGLALGSASMGRVAALTGVGAGVGAIAIRVGYPSIATWGLLVAVALAVVVALAARLVAERWGTRLAGVCAMALVFAGLAWQIGLLPGPYSATQHEFLGKVAQEPLAEKYGFDGKIYLKTMFLMKKGVPYYPAFTKAITEDKRYSAPPPLVFNYREPWPARFVALLPGNAGLDAWAVFLALVVASIVGAYVLASQFVSHGVSLLGPMLLSSYFSYSLTTKWFPLVELWAGALAVWVIVALLRERWWAGAAIVTIAVAMRELMIYLIPVGVFAWLFYPQRRRVVLPVAALVVAPAVVLAYQAMSAPGALAGGGLSTWLHGDLGTLAAALRFSSNYAPWGRWVMLVAPLAALAGALQVTSAWRKALLGAAAGVPSIALALFSNGHWGYYWGGIAAPVILSIAPLALIALLPSEEAQPC
jgi:hypothetical protein